MQIKHDHNFKKHFGQNFIKSFDVMWRVMELLELHPDDSVIEIGPGDGRFTQLLAEYVKELKVVEIDPELVAFLNEKFKDFENVEILLDDILRFKVDNSPLTRGAGGVNYKVFGALPYNISKQIIDKFIQLENKPELIVFIIQKEVAEDYVAEAPKASFLSNYIQIYADVTYEMTIDKAQFKPQPKVDGGVLKVKVLDEPRVKDPKAFAKFLKNGFRNQRKKLSKNLKSIYKNVDWDKVWEELRLDENLRAAEVEFGVWVEIFEVVK